MEMFTYVKYIHALYAEHAGRFSIIFRELGVTIVETSFNIEIRENIYNREGK